MQSYYNASLTDVLAWWGAIVATLVLLWDIYKWKTAGSRIRLSCSSNMEMFGDPGIVGKLFVSLRAKNVGERATTITMVSLIYYKDEANLRNKKSDKSFLVTNQGVGYPLPYVLQPGAIWDGTAEQNSEIEQMAKQGLLFWELRHSNSEDPVSIRVIIS